MKYQLSTSWAKAIVCGVGLAALSATGCQSHIGGQTLPSGHYLTDDIQYFAPGPEFKLSREAAAMKAYQADQDAQTP
ncbi:MAG: hypothetical protein HYV60_24910 [Planctomycetia bacterium]|nr:hypothetical protein [Planctomycetia bacterium]